MEILKKTLNVQDIVEEKTKRFGRGKYGRVLKMARKPKGDEYTKILQITGAGIIIIGGLGFLIYWLWNNLYSSIIAFIET
ncbi:MAG: protein translocase SEC61 complex subunit gamma [Thermoplasmatales archaeon]|nr:protein translocase SEC61 complex subunit gamma [Thermoplasmatales archaeon]